MNTTIINAADIEREAVLDDQAGTSSTFLVTYNGQPGVLKVPKSPRFYDEILREQAAFRHMGPRPGLPLMLLGTSMYPAGNDTLMPATIFSYVEGESLDQYGIRMARMVKEKTPDELVASEANYALSILSGGIDVLIGIPGLESHQDLKPAHFVAPYDTTDEGIIIDHDNPYILDWATAVFRNGPAVLRSPSGFGTAEFSPREEGPSDVYACAVTLWDALGSPAHFIPEIQTLVPRPLAQSNHPFYQQHPNARVLDDLCMAAIDEPRYRPDLEEFGDVVLENLF